MTRQTVHTIFLSSYIVFGFNFEWREFLSEEVNKFLELDIALVCIQDRCSSWRLGLYISIRILQKNVRNWELIPHFGENEFSGRKNAHRLCWVCAARKNDVPDVYCPTPIPNALAWFSFQFLESSIHFVWKKMLERVHARSVVTIIASSFLVYYTNWELLRLRCSNCWRLTRLHSTSWSQN